MANEDDGECIVAEHGAHDERVVRRPDPRRCCVHFPESRPHLHTAQHQSPLHCFDWYFEGLEKGVNR